jgi:hypothetical protein
MIHRTVKQPSQVSVQSEAAKYRVALEEFPEFAAQVGVLLSCFALIESYVHVLISKLTGISEMDAFIFSGSFLNFSGRVDLLKSLAHDRPETPGVRAAKHFVAVLKEATEIRNRYAHGQYSLTFEGGSYSPTAKKIMIITSFLYDARRKNSKKVERDLEGITKEVHRMKFITCQMHAYAYRGEMPPNCSG